MNVRSLLNAQTNPSVAEAIRRELGKRTPKPTGMNGLERAYAAHLDTMKAAGEVRWWAFNKVRLCIADGQRKAWFKPDFIVQGNDSTISFRETKGFAREAAMVRLKVAAATFPFPFFLVRQVEGEWNLTRYGGSDSP